MRRRRLAAATGSAVLLFSAIPVAAAQASLPMSAGVVDARADVHELNTPAKGELPIDIYRIHATTSGVTLVLTMRVRNLTRTNTRVFRHPNEGPAGFDFFIRYGGRKRWFITNGRPAHHAYVAQWPKEKLVACPGAKAAANRRTNRLRYTVPLRCLDYPKSMSVEAIDITELSGNQWWRDQTTWTPTFSTDLSSTL